MTILPIVAFVVPMVGAFVLSLGCFWHTRPPREPASLSHHNSFAPFPLG